MRSLKFFVLLLFVLSAPAVSAEELNYNLVQLYASAEENVDNDTLIVIMNAVAEASSARIVSDNVNRDMQWALDQTKKITSVKHQTMNYQTRPQYSKTTIIGWHASQQLKLESRNIEDLSHLIGTLQEKLSISSMSFSISNTRKTNAIDRLTVQAIEAFEQKARLIVKTAGANDYRMVQINVGENATHIPYNRGVQAEAMSLSKSSMPSVQAGESKINIRVDGTIQLIF